MSFPDITLKEVHNYLVEWVVDSFELSKANLLYQIAAPSNAPPKPNPINPSIKNSYNIKMYTPRMYNLNNSLPSITGTLQSQSSSLYRGQQNRQPGGLPEGRDIPIRVFNPAVPILRGMGCSFSRFWGIRFYRFIIDI